MTLPIFQRTVTDEAGNVIPNATVEVRLESTGLLATIYDDRAGDPGDTITNPLTTGVDGFAQFYAAGGDYRIKATDPVSGDVREWRYVPIWSPDSDSVTTSTGTQTLATALDDRVVKRQNVAAAVATNAAVGVVIETNTYAGVGGGNKYEVVAGGTGTADGGSFIDMDNGNQLKGLFPYGFYANQWGVIGDNSTDDYSASQTAIDYCESLGVPVILYFESHRTYRIAQGLNIKTSGVVVDFQRSKLNADFATGWAVTVGTGLTVQGDMGVRNVNAYTTQTSTSCNGIKYAKNVRRYVAYENLRIFNFKGTGLQFTELNFSIQGGVAPYISSCGINLVIGGDNVNAFTVAGIGLEIADNVCCQIRGAIQVTFLGGYIQEAVNAGVDIDTGNASAAQITTNVAFYGTYFEANGTSDIIARNGRGLEVSGSYFKHQIGTGPAINLVNWIGAKIDNNTPTGLSVGTQRDFVTADSNCTLIEVGKQNVTTPLDAQVCVSGGSLAGIIRAYNQELVSLPTASNVNKGSIINHVPSGFSSSRPYICRTSGAGVREFSELALYQQKQGAVGAGASFTPPLDSVQIFDLTVGQALTINAPSGDFKDGDKMSFIFKQSSGGPFNVTWNSVYKLDLSASGAANTHASVSFIYSAGRSVWVQSGKLEWMA